MTGISPPDGVVMNPGETPAQTLARYRRDFRSPNAPAVIAALEVWVGQVAVMVGAPPDGVIVNPGETPAQTLARYAADYHAADAARVLANLQVWAQGTLVAVGPPPDGVVASPGEAPAETVARYAADYHGADAAKVNADLQLWVQGKLAPPEPTGTSGGDMIDLTRAQIVNAPDVRGWPITAHIDTVRQSATNGDIRFDKRDGVNRWPDEPWGAPGDSLQYTIWLFLHINGGWVGSAFIQRWFDPEPNIGDPVTDYVKNWYYAARWTPMFGHVIQPGETIGYMVTAGNARDSGGPMIAERSQVVTVPAAVGTWSF